MGSNGEAVKEGDGSPVKAGLWEDFVDIVLSALTSIGAILGTWPPLWLSGYSWE